MIDIDAHLRIRTDSTFKQFAKGLSNVHPIAAGVGVAAAIAPILVYAGVMEVNHLQNIFRDLGPDAYRAYRDSQPDSTLGFLGHAIAGTLPSEWQNLTGRAGVAISTLPAMTSVAVHLTQTFGKLRAQIDALQRGEPEPRPAGVRGATRVTQLEDGLNALAQAETSTPHRAPAPRGPRP